MPDTHPGSTLSQRLALYSMAAGALGVGDAALAEFVVFTPQNGTISPGTTEELDIDGDGNTDFRLLVSGSSVDMIQDVSPSPVDTNAIFATTTTSGGAYAADITGASLIGPALANPSTTGNFWLPGVEIYYAYGDDGLAQYSPGVLGLMFQNAAGGYHFGCLGIVIEGSSFDNVTVKLGQGGYETQPGVPSSGCDEFIPSITPLHSDGFEDQPQ